MPANMPKSEKEYLGIFFRAENEHRVYKRIAYDILTYLGDLGGLMDILFAIGGLCTGIFASKLFQAALIRQAYRVQSYFRDFE